MPSNKIYDVTILGATGYATTPCAKYIAKNFPSNLRWAIARRSLACLQTLSENPKAINKDRLQPEIEIVQLRKDDLESLARRSRVIINGIGPYHRFSTPVVEACARMGTDYVDFSAKIPWIKEMIEKYHAVAKQNGATIIPATSNSSAPSELIAFLLVNEFRKTPSTRLSEVISPGEVQVAGMSGGSLTTILEVMENYGITWLLFGDPWILSSKPKPAFPRFPQQPHLNFSRPVPGYRYVPSIGRLTTSLVAVANTAIIHRSVGLRPDLYSPHFRYQEYTPAPNVATAIAIHIMTKICVLLLTIPLIRSFLRRLSFRPGAGPDREQSRATERMVFRAVGITENGNDGSGGEVCGSAFFVYEGALVDISAILAVEAAGVLLDRGKSEQKMEGGVDQDENCGVVTPSTLGVEFVDRLRKAGVKIEVEMRCA